VNCGSDNPDGQRFCGMCGSSLEQTCPRCSSPAPANARFCGTCGSPLGPGTDRTAERPHALEERRVATVAFADLSGFTALSGTTDPEEVREFVDRCMKLLGAIVDRYGGEIDKVIGDAVLAVWGVPIAREDHAERAVRAVLEMQQCARDHEAEFGGLTLRIGVNTGELMFAPVGPERSRAQTVMGDVVNVASRLQTSAPRGGILVGEETWRATRRAIHYEQVEPFRVKGKDAPLDAWLAIEALDSAPGERPLSDVPMVGRDLELEMLANTWQRIVEERRPHFVVVVGAPGIGKSRLGREFRVRVETTGGRVFRGRSVPYGERSGFGAFAEIVKQAASIFDTDQVPDALDKLRARTRSLLGDDAGREVADILAVLAGLDTEELANRALVFDAARRFVEALGDEQPTVLGFEDLHWAEESLLDLVEHLAGRVRNVSVLLVASARPELLEARPDLGNGLSSYMTLSLDVLGANAADELTREVLRGHAVAPSVLERIRDVAGGNPLFIEELASSVAEGTTDPTEGLPTSVVSVIAARLDALPQRERRILLVASVIGKVFWRSVLAGLVEGDVDDALATLETREFICRERVSEIEGDEAYSFRHMSLLEVAYNTLPRAERRTLHAEVAALLESAFGERPSALAPMLAHHWRAAGDPDRAIEYLLRAAEQADQAWAKREAVAFYSQALDLLDDGDSRRRSIALRKAVSLQAMAHIFYGDVPAPSRPNTAGD
jgi:class 3 adenylate cyclase